MNEQTKARELNTLLKTLVDLSMCSKPVITPIWSQRDFLSYFNHMQ